jgi:hypothetical protein
MQIFRWNVCLLLLVSSQVAGQNGTETMNAAPLHRAHEALTSVIVHDIFSPPVASRIYVYAHIAGYEVLNQADDRYQSLHGQVKDFPNIPRAEKSVSYGLAGVYAFLLTGQKLIFSESILEDSIQAIVSSYRRKMPRKLYDESLRYGRRVADVILAWAALDGYSETRKIRRYDLLREEGKWIPTPPAYMAAIEPHWRLIRPIALDSAAQFKPPAPTPFSKEKDTPFYDIAYHVYRTGKELSDEQIEIAKFWDCNPFVVNMHGHANYATKKLSPGGHWLSIAGIASMQCNADIVQSSAAYTLTAIALFDGFISCWDEKYRSNLIRPETYINAYIDEKWKPLLQTPPFPEHTSGHSVISTAAAVVLTNFFGDNFSFLDTSEVRYGLGTRQFKSFMDACNEAAISRLYGGIHYLPAIEYGQEQGRKVGEMVLAKIRLKRSGGLTSD